MASSTSILDLISQSQAGKEVTANALFDAGSPAVIFGRRASASSGLTWGFYGGTLMVDGVLTVIANGTLTLAASATNYVEASRAGVVSKNTTGFTAGAIALYAVIADAASVTGYTDQRVWVQPRHLTSKVSVAVTSANVTLNPAAAACECLTTTGVLTGNRDVIVPNDWRAVVFCSNSGAFATTFKTAAGTGVVVAQGKRALLLADGSSVVRVTPDT